MYSDSIMKKKQNSTTYNFGKGNNENILVRNFSIYKYHNIAEIFCQDRFAKILQIDEKEAIFQRFQPIFNVIFQLIFNNEKLFVQKKYKCILNRKLHAFYSCFNEYHISTRFPSVRAKPKGIICIE